ncbi:MAG: aminopeptidase P family protein [Bacteroidetes bacterium]|nr:aminopeptidase P family protein [Bacteroidota bacterium]
MKYLPIDTKLFKENRAKFIKQLPPKSMAIFHANDEMPYSGDANFPFRQNADLFYLSGIDQEQTILVLFPDCPNKGMREMLFLRETSELIAIWEGHKYTKEEATLASGIKKVMWVDQFESMLPTAMALCENLYININENDRAHSQVPYKDLRFAKEMRGRYPAHNFERLSPIMASLRMIKHPLEIDQIQTACNITRDAFKRILKFTKPGVGEYEIEAEITHEFLRQRSAGHAYSPIIASGASSCVLHYIDNNKACNDGEILLMDFGADYANYAADLSRTIPVNGKYSKRQKDVYNAVLRIFKEMRSMMRPSASMEDLRLETGKLVESECLALGLLDKVDIKNASKDNPAWRKYFMHGLGHSLGLDVHDLADRYKPLEAGSVYTCEPGIYILEEGIGIRIEDDILITDGDPVDLMADIPIEAEEIEELMN